MKERRYQWLFLAAWLSCLAAGSYSSENPSGANVIIRFGIITDAHYADTDKRGNRCYRESAGKMAECVEVMNRERVDFMVELGDFKDQGKPAVEATTLEYLRTIEAEFAKFRGPRFHVLGNHDEDSISKKAFLENVVNTGIPADTTYYSFVSNGVQFVVLDANFKKDGTPYDRGNFDWKDACVPGQELKWLKNVLEAHSGKSIIFVHQRLDSDNAECARNSAEIRKILSGSGKVISVFCGHDHKGGLGKIDGVNYYILKAVIEGSGVENNSYAIVDVRKDFSVKVTGFRKAQSVEMK